MNKLVVIVGPTASGKTDLSIKLAKKYNGEVISADSRQIYRGMDIGTAKPIDLQNIPHHLLNIKNPNQNYTVAQYKKAAIKAVKDIQKRGKLPIMVGGTGLYIKAVAENLDIPKIKANPLLRQKIENDVKKFGLDYVFKKLVELDPEAVYIIDSKNPRRVIRALEITLLTKKPFSAQRKSGKPLFNILEIGISTPNEKLKEKIDLRVDEMIKNGLIKEVESLIKKYGSNQQAFDAIGYREMLGYLENKKTLEQATEEIKKNTWHYAKRQITWFKREPPSLAGFGEPGRRIKWVRNYNEAIRAIDSFVKK